MSFLRMQKSPSGAVIEIPAYAGMTLFREDSLFSIIFNIVSSCDSKANSRAALLQFADSSLRYAASLNFSIAKANSDAIESVGIAIPIEYSSMIFLIAGISETIAGMRAMQYSNNLFGKAIS